MNKVELIREIRQVNVEEALRACLNRNVIKYEANAKSSVFLTYKPSVYGKPNAYVCFYISSEIKIHAISGWNSGSVKYDFTDTKHVDAKNFDIEAYRLKIRDYYKTVIDLAEINSPLLIQEVHFNDIDSYVAWHKNAEAVIKKYNEATEG